MRTKHFERLQPTCPVCSAHHSPESNGSGSNGQDSGDSAQSFRLALAHSLRTQGEHIVEGILQCTNPQCCSEFPIIDGIPIILSRLRSYIAENVFPIVTRLDFSAPIESLIGDCCSQGSAMDSMRQHTSCYAWDHYGDLDPDESPPSPSSPAPGSILRLLRTAWQSDGSAGTTAPYHPIPSGCTLDLGCGMGRSTFELAAQGDDLVLGIDLNFAMLRQAASILREGSLCYSRRRVGLVYDRRSFPVDLPNQSQIDFWVCDATALPFTAQTFTNCVALNLLDSVPTPVQLVSHMGRVMRREGQAIIACPYDWSSQVTPVEYWLGGHSQRSSHAGEAVPSVRRLLMDPHAGAHGMFEILAEYEQVPWTIRMHDRSTMSYMAHLIVARRR